jgi:mono/diheme cytochrome c family protein
LRALGGAFLAALILAVGSGCGTGGPAEGGDANQGRKLFLGEGKCGGCHTLKGAPSSGQIGPNLDEAFRQDKAEGYEQSTIENVVLDQIRFPREGSVMPADLVEGDDAEDVAAFVARCAAADPKAPEDKAACPGIAAAGAGGEGLYTSLGCQGCHSIDGSASSGPTFKGLFNSMVTLTNGKKVKADEQYLLESILDPDKQVVKGYQPGVMTSAVPKGSVPQDQAQQLVDYIKTLK